MLSFQAPRLVTSAKTPVVNKSRSQVPGTVGGHVFLGATVPTWRSFTSQLHNVLEHDRKQRSRILAYIYDQLILSQSAKNSWVKGQAFIRCCWDNWTPTCKGVDASPNLAPCPHAALARPGCQPRAGGQGLPYPLVGLSLTQALCTQAQGRCYLSF